MKKATSLVLLALLIGLLPGCQTSPDAAATNAQNKVDQNQQMVDHIDQTLNK
jgi:outer membrane biogenesis lipoprotein LolB